MDIKRNITPGETTITLTHDEMQKATAETIHKMMLDAAPALAVKCLLDRCPRVNDTEEMFGITLEEFLDRRFLTRYIIMPAVELLDEETSINEAMRTAVYKELDILKMIQKCFLHNTIHEDGVFEVSDENTDKFMHQLAANAIDINKTIVTMLAEQAAAAKQVNINTFCEETYGASLDPTSKNYILNFAAEMAIMSEKRGADLSTEDIATIALRLHQHPAYATDDGMEALREEAMALIAVFGMLSEATNTTVDGLTQELFGYNFVDAFDHENPGCLLMAPEVNDDDDSMSIICDFLLNTILHHARDNADTHLIQLIIELLRHLAGVDDDDEDDECCCYDCDGECEYGCEDCGEHPGKPYFEDGCCPVCGLPLEYEPDKGDNDADDGCDFDCEHCCVQDYPEENVCPVCGRVMDAFPADIDAGDEDPDQTRLY